MRLRRINRNIVECKVKMFVAFTTSARCINRNIVECKVLSESGTSCAEDSRINRNIVECKGDNRQIRTDISRSINRNIVECKEVLDILRTASVEY